MKSRVGRLHASTISVMPNHRIEARAPRGAPPAPIRVTDPDRLRSVMEDAAHVAGRASALVVPTTEAEIAEVLQSSAAVLPIGAQSSLTGGATPRGDVVLSTARLNRILEYRQQSRSRRGWRHPRGSRRGACTSPERYYPPAPTFTGAFVGGTVATNAAGAATFKYGTTRRLGRGASPSSCRPVTCSISNGATFERIPTATSNVVGRTGTVRVPVPRYRMPDVPKLSAGYFAAPGMDLIDLFIGAEGTLGVVVNVTLARSRSEACLVPCLCTVRGSRCRPGVRPGRCATRQRKHGAPAIPAGLNVSAIEHLDARCLELAREDGVDQAHRRDMAGRHGDRAARGARASIRT